MATTTGSHSVASFTAPINGTSPIDANSVRNNDNTLRTAYVDHDADTGIHVQSSLLAARPAAGIEGRKWITTDSNTPRQWYDTGVAWVEHGNVVGPSSATDNGVVRFNGTTGRLMQDSSVIVSDSGEVSITAGLLASNPSLVVENSRAARPANSRFQYNASNRFDLNVSSAGYVTFDAVGSLAGFLIADPIKVSSTTTPQIVIENSAFFSGSIGVDGSGQMVYTAVGGASLHLFQNVVNTTESYQVDGVKVVGNQGATISDPAGGTTIDAEARTAINTIIDRLQAHGLIA